VRFPRWTRILHRSTGGWGAADAAPPAHVRPAAESAQVVTRAAGDQSLAWLVLLAFSERAWMS
jgi:hypothetical protein